MSTQQFRIGDRVSVDAGPVWPQSGRLGVVVRDDDGRGIIYVELEFDAARKPASMGCLCTAGNLEHAPGSPGPTRRPH